MIRGPVSALRPVKTFDEMLHAKPPKLAVPKRPWTLFDNLPEMNSYTVTTSELDQLGIGDALAEQQAQLDQAHMMQLLFQRAGLVYAAQGAAGGPPAAIPPLGAMFGEAAAIPERLSEAQAEGIVQRLLAAFTRANAQAPVTAAVRNMGTQTQQQTAMASTQTQQQNSVASTQTQQQNSAMSTQTEHPYLQHAGTQYAPPQALVEDRLVPVGSQSSSSGLVGMLRQIPRDFSKTLANIRLGTTLGAILGTPTSAYPGLDQEAYMRYQAQLQQARAVKQPQRAIEDIQREAAIQNGEPNIVFLAPFARVGLEDHATSGAPLVPHVPHLGYPEMLYGPAPRPPEVFVISSDTEEDRDPSTAHAKQLKRLTAPGRRASASSDPKPKPVKKDHVKVRKIGKQKPTMQDFILQDKEPSSKELTRAGFGPDAQLEILIKRKQLASM